MKGVATVGSKGGVGKTSFAHLLALGAAWKGVPAYVFHTDDREPLKVNGRPYAYYDARSPETLETLIRAVLNEDGLSIIDSGGNRPKFDSWIADTVDLVLIPVGPDEEEAKEGLAHLDRLEKSGARNVRFILNRYPSGKIEQKYVEKQFYSLLPSSKILGKIPEMRAIRTLRQSDSPVFLTPPSKVNNLARNFSFMVNNELEAIKKREGAA